MNCLFWSVFAWCVIFQFMGFMMRRAENFVILRRKKIEVSWLFFLDRQQRWPSIGHDTVIAVFRIRIQLNPDPAKNLHPDPEDFESGSKLFLNTSVVSLSI